MKVIAIVGWKNSGKTRLVESLVSEFSRRGLKVSTLKHAHHGFDLDQSGSDSFRHRTAGAQEVLISSQKRWALMHENSDVEADILELLPKLSPVDLVVIEGFKQSKIPKIEIRRKKAAGPNIADKDPQVIAIVSDDLNISTLPHFNSDDVNGIAEFILTNADTFVFDGAAKFTPSSKLPVNMVSSMPPGVDWIPVDNAMAVLRENMSAENYVEELGIHLSAGRTLAQNLNIQRSNPPVANSAVDGFGFGFKHISNDECKLKLIAGHSAAGKPFEGRVLPGQALRILTGAALPEGVDTVVLDELTQVESGEVRFKRPHKLGANTRLAGEDLRKGETLFNKGRLIQTSDIASLAAAGFTTIPIHCKLKVAVISTGNEIASNPNEADETSIIDINRAMLISVLCRWGYEIIDLGIVPDIEAAVVNVLDEAAAKADAILISGGASSGDEDYVSSILSREGEILAWRIAMKPGRPLALARWNGTPIFGLPGNPVAAFICTLLFARPAFSLLSGGDWLDPVGFNIAANFEKQKKPGRREYLRAKLNDQGQVDIFRSEGSGLTTGLAWSDGLVELGDEAHSIHKGVMVRYYPYTSFGL